MVCGLGDIGSEKFLMVVHVTGARSNTVELVCRLWAGERPPETGQRVEGIWLVGCESSQCSTLSRDSASHPQHVGHESTSLPGALWGISGIIYV